MSGTGAPKQVVRGPRGRGPRIVIRFYRDGQWEATVSLFGRDAPELADALIRAAEERGYRLLDKVQDKFYYLVHQPSAPGGIVQGGRNGEAQAPQVQAVGQLADREGG